MSSHDTTSTNELKNQTKSEHQTWAEFYARCDVTGEKLRTKDRANAHEQRLEKVFVGKWKCRGWNSIPKMFPPWSTFSVAFSNRGKFTYKRNGRLSDAWNEILLSAGNGISFTRRADETPYWLTSATRKEQTCDDAIYFQLKAERIFRCWHFVVAINHVSRFIFRYATCNNDCTILFCS